MTDKNKKKTERVRFVPARRLPDRFVGRGWLFDRGVLRCHLCEVPVRAAQKPGKNDRPICELCLEGLRRGMDPRRINNFAGWEVNEHHVILRAMTVEKIPAGARGQKGTWYVVAESENPFDESGSAIRETVWVDCPKCGKSFTLENHGIQEDGRVNPSVVCPHAKCPYHEFAILENWNRPAQKETGKHKWNFDNANKDLKASDEKITRDDYWRRDEHDRDIWGAYH